jgi:hypothetical protein
MEEKKAEKEKEEKEKKTRKGPRATISAQVQIRAAAHLPSPEPVPSFSLLLADWWDLPVRPGHRLHPPPENFAWRHRIFPDSIGVIRYQLAVESTPIRTPQTPLCFPSPRLT